MPGRAPIKAISKLGGGDEKSGSKGSGGTEYTGKVVTAGAVVPIVVLAGCADDELATTEDGAVESC
jgi:hypothetical protein